MKTPSYILDNAKFVQKNLYQIDIVKENEKPTMYIWCSYRVGGKKKGHVETKLAYKETIHKKMISLNTSCNMFGYSYLKNGWNKDKLVNLDREKTPDFTKNLYHYFSEYDDRKLQDVLTKCNDFKYMDEKCLKYVCNLHHTQLFDFLNKWVDYPNLEILTKNNLGYMYKDKRFLKNHKDQKEYVKYILKYKDFIKNIEPSYNLIRGSFKRNEDIEKNNFISHLYDYNSEFINDRWVSVKHMRYTNDEKDYLFEQYKKHNGNYISIKYTYNDYINACNKLNIQNRKPSDLTSAHDDIMHKLKEKESKEYYDKIDKISTIVENVIKRKNKLKDLSIKMVHTYEDFSTLASTLHNCVARSEYDKKMANGKDFIFGIWKNNKPITCVEIGREPNKYTLLQCFGEHNTTNYEEYEDCKELCNLFISQRKQIELALN